MNSDSNKLLPTYRRFYKTPVKGKRTVISIALAQSKISSNSNVNLTFPKLSENVCVNPNSIYISALLENANNKSWFKNNIGRLLCNELQIRIGSASVYDNKKEGLIMVYKDLWLPDERREDMSEYGIASENLRKLMSGSDHASTSNKDDNALFKARGKRVKIKLEKILNNQGLFAPSAFNGGVEFNFRTPDASDIMIAQSGESVGGYSLKEPKLIYESIESPEMYSQAAADYTNTEFPFMDITYLKPTNWLKDQTSVVEFTNVPRKSMRAMVILFKYAETEDSEEYIYPNITKVDVTIDGRPNAVYSNGMSTDDLYREAKRIFHVNDSNMTEAKFYDKKFALVVDLRCTDDNNAINSGSNIIGTKNSVQLIIKKEATSKDVIGEIYVLSDAAVSIAEGNFSRLKIT